eukprot:1774900-Pyramimonas_sp.AAC.1
MLRHRQEGAQGRHRWFKLPEPTGRAKMYALIAQFHVGSWCPHADLRRKCLHCERVAVSVCACLAGSCVDVLSAASNQIDEQVVAFGTSYE